MIEGKKIILKLTEEADLEALTKYLSSIENRGFETISLFHEVEIRKDFEKNGFWGDESHLLQIIDKDRRNIGFMGYVNPFKGNNRVGLEISYSIYSREFWGKGYTTEALSLFVPYLFETHPVDRIQATTYIENIASQRVLEKNGFTCEGVLRKMYIYRGKPSDVKIYSILREESKALADVMK